MAEFLNGQERTKYCGQFSKEDIGKSVTALGWVAKKRDFGGLDFIDLRDRTGKVQIVFNSNNFKDFEKLSNIKHEYVLVVEGVVALRSEETINTKIATGEVEIIAHNVKILSESDPLPFAIEDDIKVNEATRLKYRYLDLRRGNLQKSLMLRNEVTKLVRRYLDEQGFIEVETPFLGKSTPEGARDYLVPSRTFPGKFFALPQSPQLYKQLLMVAGFDRYYQIARCFRDEDLRADRQPEFTQIDIEASFVDKEEQIFTILEGLVKLVFEKSIGVSLPKNFKRLTYEEAMSRFGSDKPDTRFGLEITDVSDIVKHTTLSMFSECINTGGSVRVINGKNMFSGLARRDLDALTPFVKEFGAQGLSWMAITDEGVKSSLTKFFTEELLKELLEKLNATTGDVLFFISDSNNEIVLNALGKLRLHLAERFHLIDKTKYDVLWVTDFPLFEYSKEDNRYVAKHHPFTSPKDEDLEFLESDPKRVRAKAYDLVINGYEAGGGSIRIYNQEIQRRMFKALGFTDESIQEQFGFFVNAFKYGTPPHGGIALGLDRLIMLLSNTTDIRSVIAFPKIQTAMDLMTLAPAEVELKQLEDLSLQVKTPVTDK